MIRISFLADCGIKNVPYGLYMHISVWRWSIMSQTHQQI